ncbi:hypothetical protein [Candidatus Pelagibacter sp. HIMB1623]|uniref:hypothetical protein n=1 Tax=Candidatus Pelagibacter sp. HIMB1623 TaxID=3413358 RepID=UPI003F835905
MNYVFNTTIQLFFFIFFSLSILGYGFFLKNRILRINFNFGETGILGFFALYIVSVLINFFLAIDLYISLTVLFFGLILFLKNISNIYISKKLFFFLTFLTLFISSLTINLHDDHLLYQLPYINYKQEFKIIFGFVFLNDYLAYSHGLYDIMALFKLPFYENRLVFILPIIFFMFFIFSILDYFNKEHNILSNLIIFIIFLTLFKFTRSKEFGTDVPVIGLLFLIQIYSLSYFFNNEKKYFYKMIIMFSLAAIFKIYSVLAIFYFFVFIKKFKIYLIDFFTKQKVIIIFLIFTSIVTFTKNFIHSGCLSYPATITCVDQKLIPWSAGKKLSNWRQEFLEAGVKGWNPYIRDNEYKIKMLPAEYNEKFKYNFHKNVFKDPDLERILVVVLILMSTFVFSISKNSSESTQHKPENYNYFVVISFIPLILWFLLMPYIRYGGYAYLPFGMLILFYSLFFRSFNYSKIINFLLIIGIVFFLLKNFLRIDKEINSMSNFTLNSYKTKHSYPIPFFRDFDVKEKIIDKKRKIYISNHNWLCSISNLPCLPGFWENLEIKIKEKKGYNFIYVKEKDYIKILIDKTMITHLKDNRHDTDFDKNIRSK